MSEEMKTPKLFQYAVIYHPTSQEKKDGMSSALIVEMQTCLAVDVSGATLKAARSIPNEYAEKLDRCEVAVRPF